MIVAQEKIASLRMSEFKPTDWPFHQDPGCASKYLKSKYGIKAQPPTLANWRVKGTGPKFHKDGSRIIYDLPHLDEFGEKRRGEPVNSTAETRACSRTL